MPTGKGVHAPNVTLAEHPSDKQDTQNRAGFESTQRGNENLQVTIVVQGWLKPSGGLWEQGKKAHVKSPMLILDDDLDIKSVTFSQDNKSGSRTTLELVRDLGPGRDFSSTNTGTPPGDTSTSTTNPTTPSQDPSGGREGFSPA